MAAAQKKSKSKKTAKPAKEGGPSKADFIRSLPASTPAAEVVAKAKEAGIEVTAAYVYVLRSNDGKKKKGGKGPLPSKAGKVSKKATKASVSGSGAEGTLRRAVAELGLQKAREIFASVERAFAGE